MSPTVESSTSDSTRQTVKVESINTLIHESTNSIELNNHYQNPQNGTGSIIHTDPNEDFESFLDDDPFSPIDLPSVYDSNNNNNPTNDNDTQIIDDTHDDGFDDDTHPPYDPNHPLLVDLNYQQQIAVSESPNAILQIIAGPGTGKTKTLSHRVAYLIQHYRIDPKKIILMTFTKAAAVELSERIAKLLKTCENIDAVKVIKSIQCGTFHSICRKYLVKYSDRIGIKSNFQIINEKRQKEIIHDILSTRDFHDLTKKFNYIQPNPRVKGWKPDGSLSNEYISPYTILKEIQDAKNQYGLPLEEYLATYDAKSSLMNSVLSLYNDFVKRWNYLDFSDLLLYTVKLFQKFPHFADHIGHILIDEFQDTDKIQYMLMNLFAGSKPNPITVVGDPDQSIYGFRNAVVENFSLMRERYPSIKLVHLVKNYRSSKQIVDMAQKMISLDNSRIDPDREIQANYTGPPLQGPYLVSFKNPHDEVTSIAKQIRYLCDVYPNLFSYSDIAVLLRGRRQMEELEVPFSNERIPYHITGGLHFWERKEISTFLKFFKIINSETYPELILDTLEIQKIGFGKKTLEKFSIWTAYSSELEDSDPNKPKTGRKLSLYEKLEAIVNGNLQPPTTLKSNTMEGLKNYIDLIQSCRDILSLEEYPKSCETVFDKVEKYLSAVITGLSSDKKQREKRKARIASLKKLVTSIDKYVEEDGYVMDPDTNKKDYLATFLQMAEIGFEDFQTNEDKSSATGDDEDSKNKVTISTIHGAKGLEWPVVFIPRLEHSAAFGSSIPEERRVFYVSITRPSCLCYISMSKIGPGNQPLYMSLPSTDDIVTYKEMLPLSPEQRLEDDESLMKDLENWEVWDDYEQLEDNVRSTKTNNTNTSNLQVASTDFITCLKDKFPRFLETEAELSCKFLGKPYVPQNSLTIQDGLHEVSNLKSQITLNNGLFSGFSSARSILKQENVYGNSSSSNSQPSHSPPGLSRKKHAKAEQGKSSKKSQTGLNLTTSKRTPASAATTKAPNITGHKTIIDLFNSSSSTSRTTVVPSTTSEDTDNDDDGNHNKTQKTKAVTTSTQTATKTHLLLDSSDDDDLFEFNNTLTYTRNAPSASLPSLAKSNSTAITTKVVSSTQISARVLEQPNPSSSSKDLLPLSRPSSSAVSATPNKSKPTKKQSRKSNKTFEKPSSKDNNNNNSNISSSSKSQPEDDSSLTQKSNNTATPPTPTRPQKKAKRTLTKSKKSKLPTTATREEEDSPEGRNNNDNNILPTQQTQTQDSSTQNETQTQQSKSQATTTTEITSSAKRKRKSKKPPINNTLIHSFFQVSSSNSNSNSNSNKPSA